MPATERSASPTVLVVDDDPIALEVARERLEDAGFRVEVRDHALGTSQWILQNRPEIVLLDVMMPAMQGSALAGFLKKNGVASVIILHSSAPDAELSALVAESGATGAIRKTGDPDRFLAELRRCLRAAAAEGLWPST